jgi:hypothetical protein
VKPENLLALGMNPRHFQLSTRIPLDNANHARHLVNLLTHQLAHIVIRIVLLLDPWDG